MRTEDLLPAMRACQLSARRNEIDTPWEEAFEQLAPEEQVTQRAETQNKQRTEP